MKRLFLPFLCAAGLLGQPYSLPNDNTNCPSNCRQIPWSAGSDQWNGGVLPTYTGVTCTGLAANGTIGATTGTNDGPAINTCLAALSSGQASVIPAGTYFVNTNITIPSNVALRGAKTQGSPFLPNADAAATTFVFGASGQISFGFSTSTNRGSPVAITSSGTTLQKGSTSFTLASTTGITTGTWFLVSELPDTGIGVTSTGVDGACTWCGWDDGTGTHLMNQFMMVTAPPSGGVVTTSRPLYYTLQSGLSPVIRTIVFQVTKAGIENIRLDGSAADHQNPFISLYNTLFCWVKGVETYYAGSAAKNSHTFTTWSHGDEIRDSYFHYGRDFASDENYGIYFYSVNSDHKIENNISRVNRHGLANEGGGAGLAYLYNYIDDIHEDDLTYLGAALTNHGAHPYMNLYEGNVASHLIADSYWGSSSHTVFFRNHLWGDETIPVIGEWNNGTTPAVPTFGFWTLEIWNLQHYYSAVGNVLGIAGKWGNPNWSSYATLSNSTAGADGMYMYGCPFNESCTSSYDSASYSTSINHGNYDLKTAGVAFWDGGANHTLQASIYYSSAPAFFGSCVWPIAGPDLTPVASANPAENRYLGTPCGAVSHSNRSVSGGAQVSGGPSIR